MQEADLLSFTQLHLALLLSFEQIFSRFAATRDEYFCSFRTNSESRYHGIVSEI